ncbi:MAG: hypothetical protein KAQ98_03690 [Bacteriovoracaceae bacterium]|nr:hypothetical protein [Bacteriovoracaceae bacterium]
MKKPILYPPAVFNVFKPVGMSSYDVIRHFKRNLNTGFGKIGHFGTLDPFACGVLLVGIAGATRINNLVHDLFPKTYLAVGKLGVYTETGDLTVPERKIDDGEYLKKTIASFSADFIEKTVLEKFLGPYEQSPHQYSASKFQGRPLHEWAREGVKIKKDEVRREIYAIEVVKYSFPYLSMRFCVSSGTYIRTLFQDVAKYLGTCGTLISLVRESIGHISMSDSLKRYSWPEKDEIFDVKANGMKLTDILPFGKIGISGELARRYKNGNPFRFNQDGHVQLDDANGTVLSGSDYFWIYDDDDKLVGLSRLVNDEFKAVFNIVSS